MPTDDQLNVKRQAAVDKVMEPLPVEVPFEIYEKPEKPTKVAPFGPTPEESKLDKMRDAAVTRAMHKDAGLDPDGLGTIKPVDPDAMTDEDWIKSADPTGITSIPDIPPALKAFWNEGGGWNGLALAAAILSGPRVRLAAKALDKKGLEAAKTGIEEILAKPSISPKDRRIAIEAYQYIEGLFLKADHHMPFFGAEITEDLSKHADIDRIRTYTLPIEQEFYVMQKINDVLPDNSPKMLDIIKRGGTKILRMERLDAVDLRREPIPTRTKLFDIVEQLGHIFGTMRRENIMHGDVAGNNLMVDVYGRVHIIDPRGIDAKFPGYKRAAELFKGEDLRNALLLRDYAFDKFVAGGRIPWGKEAPVRAESAAIFQEAFDKARNFTPATPPGR